MANISSMVRHFALNQRALTRLTCLEAARVHFNFHFASAIEVFKVIANRRNIMELFSAHMREFQ